MAQILVVSPVKESRRAMANLLADPSTGGVAETGNLEQALVMARLVPLDLLLVDVSTPNADLEPLIESVSAEQPLLPLIVVADTGREERARDVLLTRAAGFVPRSRLQQELVSTVSRVLAAARRPAGQMTVQSQQTHQETAFELDNDPDCVGSIVHHVTTQCCRFGLASEQEQVRVAVALEEALLNAIIHGNLEVTSDLRERSDDAFRRLVHERRQAARFAARRVRMHCDLNPERARIIIRDEGPGFDVRLLPDPRDPAHLGRASGRGVLLMRSFMDEVVYNSIGNEVTLVKRRPGGERSSSSSQQSCSR